MARIGVSVAGIERKLLDNLSYVNAQIALSALKMSTGHNINSPADNPTQFQRLSTYQTQLAATTAAVNNLSAAGTVVSQAQDGIDTIQSQLSTIRTILLTDKDHTLTPDQRAAAQAKVDEAVALINEAAGTEYGGNKLLSGSANYDFAGLNPGQVSNVAVYQTTRGPSSISAQVTQTATKAALTYTGNASNQVTADATFTLTGSLGTQSITVETGDTLASVAETINNRSYSTGVVATVDETAHTLTMSSVNYGSSAKASIAVSSGTFTTVGNTTGTNAEAVINGTTYTDTSSNVQGNTFTVNDSGFSFSITFQSGYTGTITPITVEGNAFTVAGNPDSSMTSTVAVAAMYSNDLGALSGKVSDLATGGSLSGLGDNTAQAIRVIDEALGQMTRNEGLVNGFYNASIESASALMTNLQTNLQDSIDAIDQTNDTEQQALIDYYTKLSDNTSMSMLIIAQQQLAVTDILRSIAGFSSS